MAQAANAVEAMKEFRHHRPDITLMDLRLPGTNGTDALITIRGEFPQARIIMLTTSDSDGEIQRALRAGASAYILKSMPKNEMLAVMRSVHAGKRYIPPEVAARLAEHMGEDDLTSRELDVLRLVHEPGSRSIKRKAAPMGSVQPRRVTRLCPMTGNPEKASLPNGLLCTGLQNRNM